MHYFLALWNHQAPSCKTRVRRQKDRLNCGVKRKQIFAIYSTAESIIGERDFGKCPSGINREKKFRIVFIREDITLQENQENGVGIINIPENEIV